jgi:hypothetical protein
MVAPRSTRQIMTVVFASSSSRSRTGMVRNDARKSRTGPRSRTISSSSHVFGVRRVIASAPLRSASASPSVSSHTSGTASSIPSHFHRGTPNGPGWSKGEGSRPVVHDVVNVE